MDLNNKIRIAGRVVLVTGIFSAVVALLLLLNFWQMKQHEPLESASIEALVSRLAQEPGNDALKKEIRDFDLLARKAYFTSRWQVKTGAWLLLFGGIAMAVSLKVYTDLRSRIGKPENLTEDLLRARANAQYWLFLSGGLVLGLALTAGLLTHDFLGDYDRLTAAAQPAPVDPGVEVVEIFPGGDGTGPSQEPDGAGTVAGGIPGSAPVEASGNELPDPGRAVDTRDRTGTTATGPAATTAPADANSGTADNRPAAVTRDDLKKNHSTFRGYMGLGVSYHQDIPVKWNGSTGENVKWKVAISRPGYNSPVIWGDRIFLSGGDAQVRIVACYNRHTGQLLWEREVKDIPGSPPAMPRVTDDTGLAAPTMSVDGRRVYAIFATGDIIAFDLEGNRVWARNLGVPNNHYGHSSSLISWNNKVIVQYDTNSGGRMMALNGTSGEAVWDITRPVHISWASPALIEVDGRLQVATTSDPYVAGYEVETGREMWKVEAMMGEVAPSVAFDNGIVFATNEYARLIGVKPEPGASFLWEDDEYLAEVASPVAHDGLLYVATSYGVLVCYDGSTGEKYWEKEFGEGFYSSPQVADGKLYIVDMDGITHILKADRTGTILGEPALGEKGFALPAFADGRIYLRGARHLYCIGE
ncbi:MAG: hypothetical protein EHM46_01250 [Bacteroidetes bacterium]|nr:MAG: hypothetical protein EHM46_01250 [Bacteroidota bacterium]